MAKIKVLINGLAVKQGGQITRLENFLKILSKDTTYEIFILLNYSANFIEIIPNNVVILKFNSLLNPIIRFALENFNLNKLISRYGVNVYLTFSHSLPFTKLNIPSIVGVSTLGPFSRLAYCEETLINKFKMALQKRAIIFAARRASLVIALSNACKDILVFESIPASKIIVAPNGIDDYWRRFDIKDKNLSSLGINRKFILYVSNFHKYKNHYRLIEAYKNLPCELKNLFQLVLVGSSNDSSLHFKIRSYMQTHRLSNQILILPSQGKEVLKSLYQEASLFVFPSLVENCPNILLEAMASKCPVVTSNISPMPEFCGSAVRYFNPICSESIARVIEETLQDQELILKMKERSFEQVQELTWQSFFNIIKSQINRLSLG